MIQNNPLPKISVCALLSLALLVPPACADDKPLKPPVAEDWSDVLRITKDNDWSAVPGFMGYRGDKLAGKPGMILPGISEGHLLQFTQLGRRLDPALLEEGPRERRHARSCANKEA